VLVYLLIRGAKLPAVSKHTAEVTCPEISIGDNLTFLSSRADRLLISLLFIFLYEHQLREQSRNISDVLALQLRAAMAIVLSFH
jgi:hypothetical protein